MYIGLLQGWYFLGVACCSPRAPLLSCDSGTRKYYVGRKGSRVRAEDLLTSSCTSLCPRESFTEMGVQFTP